MNFSTVEDTFPWIDSVIPKNGNLIEFGVYHGDCMARLNIAADSICKPFKEIWGFDSFAGLPENNEGNPDWVAGAFNVVRDDDFDSAEQAMKFIRARVGREVNFVKGWFDQTTTPELGKKLSGSASYIHIDCDLYSSSVTALNWLFKYRVPKVYSIIRYDDWISTAYNAGQRLAHRQIEQKYEIDFMQLSENVFMVRSY